MLARLLRRFLFVQWFMGGLLGWWATRHFGGSAAWAVLVALLFPVGLIALIGLIAAVRSHVPGSNWLWWRALWGETWAMLKLALLEMPWTVRPPQVRPALGSERLIPVVLVHGYVCNHRIFDRMTRDLRLAGHPVLAVDLEPVFASIDDYAPQVEAAVERLCRETGASQVALVGHSMGGLVIRVWMRQRGAHRVARILTLGTPHGGTRADLYPFSPNSLQMVWESAWLKDLSTNETPDGRALMQIALSPQDAIVFPQREQILPGVPVTVFEGLGHIELCFNLRVRDWVVTQLALPQR